MRQLVFALVGALLIGACKEETPPPLPEPTARAAPAVAAPAERTTGGARAEVEDNDVYSFAYSYPAAAGAIAALKSWLDADLEKRRAELARDALSARADLEGSGIEYRPYGSGVEWQVVADLPDWLSLSAEVYSYTGGAHPNSWHEALLWDKRAGGRRAPTDLFASASALSQALRRPFCAELDRQRAQKRGGEKIGGEFDACIDPVEQTVILGSSNGRTFDRIGILVAPYAAGPYAEGPYEVTLPVTPAVLAAVKPQFRQSFAAGR
jgi:hypothetical protein